MQTRRTRGIAWVSRLISAVENAFPCFSTQSQNAEDGDGAGSRFPWDRDATDRRSAQKRKEIEIVCGLRAKRNDREPQWTRGAIWTLPKPTLLSPTSALQIGHASALRSLAFVFASGEGKQRSAPVSFFPALSVAIPIVVKALIAPGNLTPHLSNMSAPPGPCPGFEAQRFRPNFCKSCLKPKVSHAQIPDPVGGAGRGDRPPFQRKTSTGSVLPPGVRPMPPGARRSYHAPNAPARTSNDSPRSRAKLGATAAAAPAAPAVTHAPAPATTARPPPRVDPTALKTFKQRQSTGPRKPITPLGSRVPSTRRRSASVFGSLRKAQDETADAAKFIPQVLLKGLLQGGMRLERAQTEELVRTALSFSKIAPAKEPLLLATSAEREFLEELQEQIKGFLEEQDELHKIINAQSFVRRWLVTKRFHGLQPEDYAVMKRRNDTYLDLVRTEKSYIASTDNLIEYFVVPLRHQDFIAPHECASLFSNIELIATAHKDLLKELDAAAQDWPFLGNVGRIFLNINPMLKAYSVFVGNFKNAINEIERIQQENPKFAAFIAEVRCLPTHLQPSPQPPERCYGSWCISSDIWRRMCACMRACVCMLVWVGVGGGGWVGGCICVTRSQSRRVF